MGTLTHACVLGSGGPVQRKREGDGGTPIARMTLLAGRYRNDRLVRPRTRLPLTCLKETDGWCDDPGDGRYNQAVRLPVASGHERMMRSDGLYDVVLVLDWNMLPRVRGRGSAIFFHLARADRRPTEGCIAVDRAVMPRLLARLGPGAVFEVHGVTPRKGTRRQ
ncbi:MAG: L,D-transpeptidase family protein [Pseudomonadota bacterium]